MVGTTHVSGGSASRVTTAGAVKIRSARSGRHQRGNGEDRLEQLRLSPSLGGATSSLELGAWLFMRSRLRPGHE